ncbi:MAG: trypsin-like peptidase domain-containing protein [Paracoccaceae bacterium]|nr:trypsin-like peptidase domain-containing protein [Paracoccaceae bacterium]
MTVRHMAVFVGMLGAGLTALPVGGQVSGQHPLAAQESAQWGAVGRITYGATPQAGAAICTGSLVAPDRVLTAAHCVTGGGANAPMSAANLRFSAGWRDGAAVATRRGAEVILAGGQTVTDGALAQDMALIVLDTPITTTLVKPLPFGPPARPGETFALVGYRRDHPQIPYLDPACMVLGAVPPVLALTCAVVSGNSGAPVLRQTVDGWQIVAVMVAQVHGIDGARSYAITPPDELRDPQVR